MEETSDRSSVLMGVVADSVALTASTRTINEKLSTCRLENCIKQSNPTHYISRKEIKPKIKEQLDDFYDVEPLKQFSIYPTRSGPSVHLYLLQDKQKKATQ